MTVVGVFDTKRVSSIIINLPIILPFSWGL